MQERILEVACTGASYTKLAADSKSENKSLSGRSTLNTRVQDSELHFILDLKYHQDIDFNDVHDTLVVNITGVFGHISVL